MSLSAMVFCASDIVAGVFRGVPGTGMFYLLYFANGLYISTLVLISYFWAIYAVSVLNERILTDRFRKKLMILPLAAVALIVTSPFTHLIYRIDPATNLYSRGTFSNIANAVCWLYLLVPSLIAVVHMVRTPKQKYLSPIANFALAPLVAGIVQNVFYGLTTVQAGLTISILLIFLRIQSNEFHMDGLTGINNRAALNENLDRFWRGSDREIFMMMIDINRFKSINDTYGHLVGDQFLVSFADDLKRAAAKSPDDVDLYRYGGDEFVVVGYNGGEAEAAEMLRKIKDEVEKSNKSENFPCELSISIGAAFGNTSDYHSPEDMLKVVDEKMYIEKENFRRENGVISR